MISVLSHEFKTSHLCNSGSFQFENDPNNKSLLKIPSENEFRTFLGKDISFLLKPIVQWFDFWLFLSVWMLGIRPCYLNFTPIPHHHQNHILLHISVDQTTAPPNEKRRRPKMIWKWKNSWSKIKKFHFTKKQSILDYNLEHYVEIQHNSFEMTAHGEKRQLRKRTMELRTGFSRWYITYFISKIAGSCSIETTVVNNLYRNNNCIRNSFDWKIDVFTHFNTVDQTNIL